MQDVILEPLEDDCRLLQSLLDGVLKIEIGPDLLQKAYFHHSASRGPLFTMGFVTALRSNCVLCSSDVYQVDVHIGQYPQRRHMQVMRIRSLAECSSNLAACGDAVRFGPQSTFSVSSAVQSATKRHPMLHRQTLSHQLSLEEIDRQIVRDFSSIRCKT